MDAHYTSNFLLSVIYRELPADQLDPIFEALKLDEKLRTEFLMLKETKQKLSAIKLEPAQSSIDRILAYSRGE